MKFLSLLALSLALCSAGSAQQKHKQLHELNERIGTAAHYQHRLIPAHYPSQWLESRLKLRQFGNVGTPLGIYVKKGDELIISLDNAPEKGVTLFIRDHAQALPASALPLQAGDNSITAPQAGLLYIDYAHEHAGSAPDLRASIKGGQISGIYYLGDGEKAWSFALRATKSGFVELLSDHVHLILPAEMLRAENIPNGDALLHYFNDLFSLSKAALGIGSMLPDRLPALRIHHEAIDNIRIDEQGVALDFAKHKLLGAAEEIVKPWQLPHLIARDCLMPKDMSSALSEALCTLLMQVISTEKQGLRYGQAMLNTERYQQYYVDCILNQQAETSSIIPLWTLLLYNREIMGNKYFLPRLMEHINAVEWDGLSEDEVQSALLKCLCAASKLDFSEYFAQVGLLPTSISDEVKQYAKRYPEPDFPQLYFINKDTIKIYKAEIAPYRPAKVAMEFNTDHYLIAHAGLEGIVAIEAYQGDTLVGLATVDMCDETYIHLAVKEEADKIIAVGWEGTRLELSAD